MKNNKRVRLGIIMIVVISLATGCKFYNLLETQDFKEHFGALGYTISDSEETEYKAESYLVASKEDIPYKIEYYEFAEEVDAKKAYKDYSRLLVLLFLPLKIIKKIPNYFLNLLPR